MSLGSILSLKGVLKLLGKEGYEIDASEILTPQLRSSIIRTSLEDNAEREG